MPRGDGTGPQGAGSMTGRAAGYCAGFGQPDFANAGPGFGRGRGGGMGRGAWCGGGRGWRNMVYATGLPGWQRGAMPAATPTPEQQQNVLKAQAAALEQQLGVLQQQLAALKSGTEA